MAMGSTATPSRRLRDVLAGLFAEALELERRRRRRFWVLALLVGCVVAAGVLVFGSGGGGAGLGRTASGGASPPMVLGSRTLPALGENPLLSVAGKWLVVSDTDDTTFVDGRVGGTCAAATVDPASLRLISVARGNCGDPSLFDQHVIPVTYVPTVHDHSGWGVNPLAMRISVAVRSAPTGYRVGPVIVTYPDGSDMRAETIDGDGSLWVYAPLVGLRLSHAELLRVSLRSGRVLERWRMPPITRALLATNADGLWLAPSNESGYSGHATAGEEIAQASLYHITPGTRTPARVFDVGAWGARWLVAHRHSVWLARGRSVEHQRSGASRDRGPARPCVAPAPPGAYRTVGISVTDQSPSWAAPAASSVSPTQTRTPSAYYGSARRADPAACLQPSPRGASGSSSTTQCSTVGATTSSSPPRMTHRSWANRCSTASPPDRNAQPA